MQVWAKDHVRYSINYRASCLEPYLLVIESDSTPHATYHVISTLIINTVLNNVTYSLLQLQFLQKHKESDEDGLGDRDEASKPKKKIISRKSITTNQLEALAHSLVS